jgi:hypothetical protein
VQDVQALQSAMIAKPLPWTDNAGRQGLAIYRRAAQATRARAGKAAADRQAAQRLALVEGARQVLVRTALVEILQSQQADLFDKVATFGFGGDVVQALKRHGSPFKPLLKIAEAPDLEATATHPLWTQIQGDGKEALQRRWDALKRQAQDIAEKYASWLKTSATAVADTHDADDVPVRVWLTPWRVEMPSQETPDSTANKVLPFRRLQTHEARPFRNCVPMYDSLKAAAGAFSDEQFVDEVPDVDFANDIDRFDWVELPERIRPQRGLFVAQVVGESMNRRIPNGSWCLWRLNPAGTRQGKVVLAEHRDIFDGDIGGHFTVKVYESEKRENSDGSWEHVRIVLRPDSTEQVFEPFVFDGDAASELRIVAELVDVLS